MELELTRAENAEPEHHERTKRRRFSPLVQNDRHEKVKIKKEAIEASSYKLHKADVTDIEDEMEILRRKKLKLLRDSDWLGLNLQEPVKLKYAPTGVDDNIGRRRRLKPGHEARYDKTHVRLSPARHHNYDTRSEVRVTIGGKERRADVRSSAAPSKGTAPPISSQSSDVMLLDNDRGRIDSEASHFSYGQHGSRRQGHRRSNSYMSEQRAYNAALAVPNKHGKADTPPREDLGLLAAEATRQPRADENAHASFSSSSIRKMAEARGYAVHDDEEGDRLKSLFSSSQHSGSQVLPPLPPVELYGDGHVRHNGRLIMPSSPPSLHHPVPRRATSQILRTNSLDLASSAAATVGELPKLTEAEEHGDKMWKEWLDEDAADGSDAGPGPDEEDREQSPQRSITPGVSQYVPQGAPSQSSQSSRQSPSIGASAELSVSVRGSDASMPQNMMRLSSSVNSTTLSASRTPSLHNQAINTHGAAPAMVAPTRPQQPAPQPEVRQRVSLPLPVVPVAHRVDDDAAWKTFLQSPSELRFNSASLRPLQKPPIRRPPPQEKQKRKAPDPDAAWKSFVLTNDSDSEEENAAFNSFLKNNGKKTMATRKSLNPEQSSSHASLEVHALASMEPPELPELPFSKPGTRTPGKTMMFHAPFLWSSTSDYFNDTQVLDDRSMYANQSQISSTTGNLETDVLDDMSMYANQSQKSITSSSLSSPRKPFQLNKETGQTMIEGFFKPPPKLHAKPPVGPREQSTFKRSMPFGIPHKAGKQSFVDGLDKKYVQETNRELRKELWKKPNGMKHMDRENEKKWKERQTKSKLGHTIK